MRIAVVIPFYQTTPALLARAVCSALGQARVAVTVLVIDDGSPLRATNELAGVPGGAAVQVIEQSNAGPAAARNRGLDALPDSADAVAFLDSDDTWHPDHLANAAVALGCGADFYFSDWQRPAEPTRFALPTVARLQGEPLAAGTALFRYRGDLFDAILRGSPVGTSGVVYRRAAAPDLRFIESLRAGEDNLFWMGLARSARSVIYTTRCEAFYGRGVNIAAGATWRDPRALSHLAHAARMHRLLPRLHYLTADQRRWNNRWRAELRRSYARNLLAILHHGGAVGASGVAAFVQEEPRLLLALLDAAIWGLRQRMPAVSARRPAAGTQDRPE